VIVIFVVCFLAYIGEGFASEMLERYLIVLMQENARKVLGFGELEDSSEGNGSECFLILERLLSG
jgi:hypothetical protein